MAKTPYEIRLDLLYLGQSILTNAVESRNSEEIINAEKTGRGVKLDSQPSTDDVLAEAGKLKSFVDDSKGCDPSRKPDGKRVFYVDVGDMSPERAEKYIDAIKEEFSKRK